MEGSDAIKAKQGESVIKIMLQGIQCCREDAVSSGHHSDRQKSLVALQTVGSET